MAKRLQKRAEETKQAVQSAAGKLFAKRGFDAVSMRQIANEARCSHTTIYMYFKDKEALLCELAREPLLDLGRQMDCVMGDASLSPNERVAKLCGAFLRFSLENRAMYKVLFLMKASRVDVSESTLEIQKLRVELFGYLRRAIADLLGEPDEGEEALAYARIFFYTLHGIVSTYVDGDEPYDILMDRLAPTFERAIAVLTAGAKHTSEGRERHGYSFEGG